MRAVQMEGCSRCRERWFAMALKDTVCHKCYLRDPKDCRPCLMSADNMLNPGPVTDALPELTQVEEMIIARSHVQMVLFRYRGHQYHYSGHCNTVKTVTVITNLPADLDIVLVRPPDTAQNLKYISP
ncbi:hypothetical protein HYALB_00004638 [Hymenoscyphus albidus]|uniref:DUF6570 domain-containing protein n=1 Tax=Hymenoscyphus albidus TaxID=595503 RepID=A0A9N9M5S6_9HELO|nr:hypothetical protein HYALB_00004638 [Hymenoscyphus albidus]